MTNGDGLQRQVTFCAQDNSNISQRGRQAELDTVQFLVDNLNTRSVGDYRILVNYNMPLKGQGATGTLEIDVVVINKFGVFLLEVKNWQGVIEAYNDHWLQGRKHRQGNVFNSIQYKAKIFYSNWFGRGGRLNQLGRVNVSGLVVLANGKDKFFNYSDYDDRLVVGIDPALIQAMTRNHSVRELTNEHILKIKDTIYGEHETIREERIGDYRIIGKLSPGNLFEAFEAVSINLRNLRVRIKRYRLDNISGKSDKDIKQFRWNAEAVSKMGVHPNIVQTLSFFPDPNRPDIFYEVTEFIKGSRLDEIMAQTHKSLTLKEQLDYVEPLCTALVHAHKNEIYHRNINPETVFVTQDGVVKLADFDFAKILGEGTIVQPDRDFVNTPMTAPEIRLNPSAAIPPSDIYSLGALWFFLASLPKQLPQPSPEGVKTLKGLPESARTLIKKMIVPAIHSRPQSAEEVLEQIQTLRRQKKY